MRSPVWRRDRRNKASARGRRVDRVQLQRTSDAQFPSQDRGQQLCLSLARSLLKHAHYSFFSSFSPCQQRNSNRAGVELLPRRRPRALHGVLGPGGSGGATRRVAIVPDQTPTRLFPLRTNCFFPLSTLNEEGLQRGGATLPSSLSLYSLLSLQPRFICHPLVCPPHESRALLFLTSQQGLERALRMRARTAREGRRHYCSCGSAHWIHVAACLASRSTAKRGSDFGIIILTSLGFGSGLDGLSTRRLAVIDPPLISFYPCSCC